MDYFLIDYENIGADRLKDFQGMREGAVFAIFYSEHCKNISLDVIGSITKRNMRIVCNKAITGTKNALDFQLSSYLGYLIGKDDTGSYHIVSNDKGYDCLCSYWKERMISIDRMDISDPVKVEPEPNLP